MRCLFLRSVKGYAYFKGDTGELPDEVAADLVEALEEIKGIGKKMAGTIIEYCESYEG